MNGRMNEVNKVNINDKYYANGKKVKSSDSRFLSEIDCNGVKIITVIDTGAERSLLDYNTFLKIFHGKRVQMRNCIPLISASGDSIKTLGATDIFIKNKKIPVTVVKSNNPDENPNNDLLLGIDALKILQAQIDCANHKLWLNNKICDLITEKSPGEFEQIHGAEQIKQHPGVENLIKNHQKLFSEDSSGILNQTHIVECDIDTGSHPPIKQRAYRVPLNKRKIIDKEIDNMLKLGVIQPSKSNWASPVTVQPKKGGEHRFCIDFRKVNDITTEEIAAIPRIDEIFDELGKAKFFTALDLKSAYWQVPLTKRSRHKTAFICHKGLFEFLRMPFGVRNAPALFQRSMSQVLQKFIGTSCFVYLDDIVIYSETLEEHIQHVDEILSALEEANLKLKPSKCSWFQDKIKLLGFSISQKGIESDPEKVIAIRNLKNPTTIKQLRSFLGSTNYFRSLIKNYAKKTEPLNRLLKKKAKFIWTEDQQKAFDELKSDLTNAPVLAYPDTKKEYNLYCDASDGALGSILTQKDDTGLERPIQYVSKSFADCQKKWSTLEKEAFSIMYSLEKLKHYLIGAKFTIYTDNQPCVSLFKNPIKNAKLERWALNIASYNAPIVYLKGKSNVNADFLSRIESERMEENAEELIEEKDTVVGHIIPAEAASIVMSSNDKLGTVTYSNNGKTQVYNHCNDQHLNEYIPWDYHGLKRDEVIKLQKRMKEYELGVIEEMDFMVINDVLYSLKSPPMKPEYPRLVVPPGLRTRLIDQVHEEVGHQAVRKTLEKLQESYKWPGQLKDVISRLRICPKCIRHRKKMDRPYPESLPIPKYPYQYAAVDLSGPYPCTKEGYRYLLSYMDHFSGWVESIPLKSKEASEVTDVFHKEIIPRYGVPEVLTSDNGLEFKNDTLRPYLTKLGTKVRYCTPYHPQANGHVERYHSVIKTMLAKLVNSKTSNWLDKLPAALWSHRISSSNSTGFSPYFLMYARDPPVPFQKVLTEDFDEEDRFGVGRRLRIFADNAQAVANNIEKSRQYNVERLQARANAKEVRVNDHIAIKAFTRSTLDPMWDFGYRVTEVRGNTITCVDTKTGKMRKIKSPADTDCAT